MADEFIDEAKTAFEEIINFLKEEMKKIHAGRASIDLVGDIVVDVYGSRNKISNMASLSFVGAREIIIEPWDKNIIKEIEKGILKSPLNLTVHIEDKNSRLRVSFPTITQESKSNIVKLIHQKKEQARVALRHNREKIIKKIEEQFRAKTIGEDRRFQLKKDIQKIADEYTMAIDDITKRKEEEVLNI